MKKFPRYINDPSMLINRPEEELVELLWQDGQVIMHKQSNRRSTSTPIDELNQDPAIRCIKTSDKSNDILQDEETSLWFQQNLYDPFDRDLYSEFFCDVPSKNHIEVHEFDHSVMDDEPLAKLGSTKQATICADSTPKPPNCFVAEENINLPPRFQAISSDPQANSANTTGFINANCLFSPPKTDPRLANKHSIRRGCDPVQKDTIQSSSTMTKISSKCDSNHVRIQREPSQALWNNALSSRDITNARTMTTQLQNPDTTPPITSSSGGSRSSIGKKIHQTCSNQKQKRKQMDTEDTDFNSEDCDEYSIEPSKQHPRSTSMRRSRSAEVHNLSERRRRDRINEKLKALQDLIPHCSKTDKASVLDEAIEYLKTLQMQVQFMWMGSGMAQMMLPNLQHYLSSLSMGMAQGSMTPIPGSIQMPRVPMFNQHILPTDMNNRPFPVLGPLNNSTQMQNVGISDVYACYAAMQQLQTSPQVPNSNPLNGDVGQQKMFKRSQI